MKNDFNIRQIKKTDQNAKQVKRLAPWMSSSLKAKQNYFPKIKFVDIFMELLSTNFGGRTENGKYSKRLKLLNIPTF